jgi:uncharacterized protein with HEPN domain
VSRDPKLRLLDIVDACDRIQSHIRDMDSVAFDADLKTQDAVIRVFEIIGEAVKALPEEWKLAEPGIPWRQISGFRDVLAHSYFAVNSSVVWTAATQKAPELRLVCLRMLKLDHGLHDHHTES